MSGAYLILYICCQSFGITLQFPLHTFPPQAQRPLIAFCQGLYPGVSLEILIRLNEPIDFLCKVRSRNENPLFLRFKASAVTLSGSQAGNTCPFPALKAGLSPSCSPRWVPHCSQPISAQKQWVSLKTQETPVISHWYFIFFHVSLALSIQVGTSIANQEMEGD